MYGARTGIGVAVDHTLRALGQIDDGPELVPYLLSFRGRPAPGVRRLGYPAALAHRCWSRIDWPPVERFIGDVGVIHGTNYVVPPSRAARLVTVYDCWFLEHPTEVHPDVRRAGEVLRRSVRQGATVHASSTATAAKARVLLDTDRVEVIHLGAPDPIDAPPPGSPGPAGRLAGGPPFIVGIGTLERRKNLPRLIAAFGTVHRSRPDLELLIAGGDGDDVAAAEHAIRQLPPPARAAVQRLGRITDTDKAWLLHHAQALAYPSLDEGFGFPLLEAMQVGLPVVASTAGSLPEIAGDAAMLVDSGDVEGLAAALLTVTGETAVRRRLIDAGHARVAAFSWSATATQLTDLYAALAMERGTR